MRMSIHLCATFPDSCPSALEEKEEEAEKDREARANSLLSTYVARSAWDVMSQPAALDSLKSDNTVLLQHLSALDQHTPTNSDANVEEQLLDAELKQRNKRTLRLRQVFKGKMAEFCEALSAILGVKLTFYNNGQVCITSQYDLGAAFIFQPALKDASGGGGARMQLIAQGEGGPQELLQPMWNWVEVKQSIPCFLASVTLRCYDKWKRE
ncbi:hypothetical protein EDB86DRAFT_3181278 [Lactarius hatsudake]|nr:hypothetical protein EDB86DRAFT_3181278 [Lactarius hatsudake]